MINEHFAQEIQEITHSLTDKAAQMYNVNMVSKRVATQSEMLFGMRVDLASFILCDFYMTIDPTAQTCYNNLTRELLTSIPECYIRNQKIYPNKIFKKILNDHWLQFGKDLIWMHY